MYLTTMAKKNKLSPKFDEIFKIGAKINKIEMRKIQRTNEIVGFSYHLTELTNF